MTARHAAWLLAAVIAARATSFLFSTILLADMGPLTLLGVRFTLAFAVLVLLVWWHLRGLSRRAVLHGCLMGAAFFATMAFELHALTRAPSSTVSLLENLAIVIVPLAEALLLRRAPRSTVAVAATLAVGGVACLTVGNNLAGTAPFGPGEGLALLAALCYSAAILVTARFSREGDALALGIVQIGVMGALGLAAAFLFEQPTLPAGPLQWEALAVLVVVCTGFGFTLQPVAQRHLSAERASLFCATTPLVASLLGITLLGEPAGPATFVGLGLIISAMVVANLPMRKRTGVTQADAKAGAARQWGAGADARSGRTRGGIKSDGTHGGARTDGAHGGVLRWAIRRR